MRIGKRFLRLPLFALLVASIVFMALPVFAQQPPFSATINITGDLEVLVGESTMLTADWSTNRDVTRYEWLVDGAGQGVVEIPGASAGSATFNFMSNVAGAFTISFRIWHHVQTDRDAQACVVVTVTEPECELEYVYETAFAYGGVEFANRFLDHGFSRWGWTNGPLSVGSSYSFELYAGAGQCDLSKGVLVGSVDVVIAADGSLTVAFNVASPYVLDETHVYAGSDLFPTKNGKYTVAPGQYYVEPDLSGDIYVIVHAVVGIPVP